MGCGSSAAHQAAAPNPNQPLPTAAARATATATGKQNPSRFLSQMAAHLKGSDVSLTFERLHEYTFVVINVATGRCLSLVATNNDGTGAQTTRVLMQIPRVGCAAQQFKIERVGENGNNEGLYRLISFSTRYPLSVDLQKKVVCAQQLRDADTTSLWHILRKQHTSVPGAFMIAPASADNSSLILAHYVDNHSGAQGPLSALTRFASMLSNTGANEDNSRAPVVVVPLDTDAPGLDEAKLETWHTPGAAQSSWSLVPVSGPPNNNPIVIAVPDHGDIVRILQAPPDETSMLSCVLARNSNSGVNMKTTRFRTVELRSSEKIDNDEECIFNFRILHEQSQTSTWSLALVVDENNPAADLPVKFIKRSEHRYEMCVALPRQNGTLNNDPDDEEEVLPAVLMLLPHNQRKPPAYLVTAMTIVDINGTSLPTALGSVGIPKDEFTKKPQPQDAAGQQQRYASPSIFKAGDVASIMKELKTQVQLQFAIVKKAKREQQPIDEEEEATTLWNAVMNGSGDKQQQHQTSIGRKTMTRDEFLSQLDKGSCIVEVISRCVPTGISLWAQTMPQVAGLPSMFLASLPSSNVPSIQRKYFRLMRCAGQDQHPARFVFSVAPHQRDNHIFAVLVPQPATSKLPPLFLLIDSQGGCVLHMVRAEMAQLKFDSMIDEQNPAQHFSFAVVGRGIESPSSGSSDDAVDELQKIRRDLLSLCDAAHVVSKRDEIMSKREAVSAITIAVQKRFARLMRSAIAGIFVTSNNSNTNAGDVKCGSLSPAAAAFSAAQVVVQASSALSHDETEESDTARNAVVHLLLSKAFKKPVEEVARQLTIDAVIQACAMTSVDKQCYGRLFDSVVRETPAMCVFFARGGGILAMPTPLLEVVVDFAAAAELKSLVFELCSAWGATAGMQQRTAAAPAMRAALCGLAWKCLCRRLGMELLREQQQEQEQQQQQGSSPSARLTLIRLMVLDALETLKQLAFQSVSSDAQVLLQQGLHDTRSRSASEVVLESQLILNTQGEHYLRAIVSAATGCSLLLEPIDASDSGNGNNGNDEALAKDSLYSVRDAWSGFFAEFNNVQQQQIDHLIAQSDAANSASPRDAMRRHNGRMERLRGFLTSTVKLAAPPVSTVAEMHRLAKQQHHQQQQQQQQQQNSDNAVNPATASAQNNFFFHSLMTRIFTMHFDPDYVAASLVHDLVQDPEPRNAGFVTLVKDVFGVNFAEVVPKQENEVQNSEEAGKSKTKKNATITASQQEVSVMRDVLSKLGNIVF